MSAKRKRRWPWLLALVVIVALVVVISQRGGAGAAPLDPALVVTAKRSELVLEVVETGKVEARNKVELKSKVPGQVAEVLVDEGAQVKKGDLLVVLDPTDYQRELARAEAELAHAQASVAYAKLVLGRKTAGVEGAVVPAHELDAARHDLATKDISVRQARVAVDMARDRLRYTKIVAPMAGTVIQRGIEPGEVVTPGVQATFNGEALLVVADLSTLVVKIEVNQIDVAKIQLGQAATLTLDALPGKTYEARVTKIAPASTRPQGRDVDVFPIEAELTAADAQIKPGMSADVRIRLDVRRDVLTLPIEAVRESGGKARVTRVLDGPEGRQTTEEVEVVLGARTDREVEVVRGIEEGNRVLLEPGSAAANETQM
ncbi:MAG TPA: efflux RND transporter periplasmic adaptor subunit [Polyangium sp.]|nr:efflux RND transporter periplasmic adaptor subunit [Polyangium sp.]